MNFKGRSLAEVAALVSRHLADDGMNVIVVGGSAITAHAPNLYTSHDIDFAVLSGVDRKKIAVSLAKIGFIERGREYVHDDSDFSLDFVADTPYVDRRMIRKFHTIETPQGPFKTLTIEDAISDRVAGFVHWNDRQGLSIAERLAQTARGRIRAKELFAALDDIDAGDGAPGERLGFARRRLQHALDPNA